MADPDVTRVAELAARSAKRWALLAMLVATVFVVLTVVDNGIKRDVIGKVVEARRTLDEFRDLLASHAAVVEVGGGSSGEAAAGRRAGGVAGDGVGDAAGASAAPAGNARRPRAARPDGPVGES